MTESNDLIKYGQTCCGQGLMPTTFMIKTKTVKGICSHWYPRAFECPQCGILYEVVNDRIRYEGSYSGCAYGQSDPQPSYKYELEKLELEKRLIGKQEVLGTFYAAVPSVKLKDGYLYTAIIEVQIKIKLSVSHVMVESKVVQLVKKEEVFTMGEE